MEIFNLDVSLRINRRLSLNRINKNEYEGETEWMWWRRHSLKKIEVVYILGAITLYPLHTDYIYTTYIDFASDIRMSS